MFNHLRQRYRHSLVAQAQFRRLWLSSFVTELGAKFSMVAVPLLAITQLHAGPFQTGLMVACGAIGFAVASLLAGVLADRYSPRTLLIRAQMLLASALFTIPLLYFSGGLGIVWLYVLELAMGLGLAIIVASGYVYSARLAGPSHVVEANSLFFGCESLAGLLGPGVAGWLVGWLMPVWAITIDGACIFISILLLLPNPEPVMPAHLSEKAASLLSDFKIGWQAVWQNSFVRMLSFAGAIYQILFHGHIALQVLFATKDLGLTPVLFGLALTFGGVGALLASLLTPAFVRMLGEKRLLLVSLVILAFSWIGFAALPKSAYTMLLYVPLILVFDMAVTSFQILFVSTRQMAVPHNLLGRVTATSRFLAYSAAPLGGIVFGWMGAEIGLRWTYVVMGFLGIAFTVVLAWALRNQMNSVSEPVVVSANA